MKMLKGALALLFIIVCSMNALAVLQCTVRQSACNGGETKLLGMSNVTDAHAELPGQNSADYLSYVCCKDDSSVATITNTCSGGTTFLRLAGATNAHVEEANMSTTEYNQNACINSGVATFSCSYKSSCGGSEACLVTINQSTDSHVGDCTTAPYGISVCCAMSYTNTAPNITSVAASTSPIKGGATETLTPSGVVDAESDTLTLYCSGNAAPNSTNDKCTGGTRTGGSPYSLTCTFNAETDDTTHTVYCRVFDGTYYSSAVSTTYTTDSTPPAAVSIIDVDGDTSAPYWDSSNNSQTVIQTNKPEANMLCRWSNTSQVYSAISSSHDCPVGGTISCNLGFINETANTTVYISCRDSIGNDQSTSQNTAVNFGVDWTAPTTFVTGYGSIYTPGHTVIFNESDNIGTPATILTWYCVPTSGCTPATPIDNQGTVAFSNRGTNYLRWFSTDAAQNQQATQTVTVEINQLPVITDSDMGYTVDVTHTGKHNGQVIFNCYGSDANGVIDGSAGYSANIWLRQSGSGIWNRASAQSMTWNASLNKFTYLLTLDDPADISGEQYDMECQITDDYGESSNHTVLSIFSVDNSVPTLSSVSAAPSPIKGGSTVTITSAGVSHPDGTAVSFYCAENTDQPDSTHTICTGGTTSANSPYALNCTFAVPVDDTSHTVNCRVYDGEEFSAAVSTSYTTDSTPPSAASVVNVDGDSSAPYWDTSNNGQTIIQLDRPDSTMLCRWSISDQVYSAISGNDCSVGPDSVSCNVGSVGENASTTRYISCRDAVGNEQSTSQNTDVTFGVDWSVPTTYVSGYGSVYLPGHPVQFHEQDNIGTPTTILTWHCEPTLGCTPATPIDNLENVTFSSRGTNYLSWFSIDPAGNQQPTHNVSVEINSLPVVSTLQSGIGASPYTGKHGQRVMFYCAGTDPNGVVDGSAGYSAKIWLRYTGQSNWLVQSASMTWAGVDHRWQYDRLLDNANDVYNASYDMVCEITDDFGEPANATKVDVFNVVNTPPVVDDISVSNMSAKKFSIINWYCDGVDADAPVQTPATLTARFWLRTRGAGSWNRLENVPMLWDGTHHYYTYQVLDDGGTHYDAQCQLSDGVDSSTLYQELQTEYAVIDDWDGDGIPDAIDTLGGTGANINSTVPLNVLVNGGANTSPTGLDTVQIKDTADNLVLVNFTYNFSASTLNLPTVGVVNSVVNGNSYVSVTGLAGIVKTINLPKSAGTGTVCAKNQEISSASEVSATCTGANETLFSGCIGQTLNGITCVDKGSYYQLSGLTGSAAIEFGTSRLAIWSIGTMRSGATINFKANYSNIADGSPITDGSCQIDFPDTGWTPMDFNSPLWNYSRTFDTDGHYVWQVNCTSLTETALNVSDSVDIVTVIQPVPEFSTWALIVALGLVVAGVFAMRKR